MGGLLAAHACPAAPSLTRNSALASSNLMQSHRVLLISSTSPLLTHHPEGPQLSHLHLFWHVSAHSLLAPLSSLLGDIPVSFPSHLFIRLHTPARRRHTPAQSCEGFREGSAYSSHGHQDKAPCLVVRAHYPVHFLACSDDSKSLLTLGFHQISVRVLSATFNPSLTEITLFIRFSQPSV